MNNFLPTIGIEVHIALNTKSKMFSPSRNNHNDPINTNINEIDLALPGSMPSVNEMAVVKAIRLATALNMKIDQNVRFDRKNYFYQDLPKGFQITQQFYPIGKDGKIDISNKSIGVERIHMEEDTAKQLMIGDKLCLDYNRAGVPLIEVVSRPDIHSAVEAYEYLNNLKRIVSFLDISDAKMEDGSMRADINISIAPRGSDKLGTKVEIKNINSFNNIMKAIDYEIDRQSQLLLTNNEVKQETRRWDDATKSTVFMRAKTNAIEYSYFTEPNIIHILLTTDFVNNAIGTINKYPSVIKKELEDLNINSSLINLLLDDYDLYKIFNKVATISNNPTQAITWIVIELVAILKKQAKSLKIISNQQIDSIIEMISLIDKGEINGKQAKTIFEKIILENKKPKDLIEQLGFKQITDQNVITNILNKIIKNNPNMVQQYNERPERAEKFFIGQLMKETHGQANPVVSMKLLKELLKK